MGLTEVGRMVDLLALGVAISNADWREQVGEGGGDAMSSLAAGSISSPVRGGCGTSTAVVERPKVGGPGRLPQSL